MRELSPGELAQERGRIDLVAGRRALDGAPDGARADLPEVKMG